MIEIERHGARPVPRFALFQYGFRPFFLFGAAYAAIAPIFWVLIWRGDLSLTTSVLPSLWHSHEMVFGFAAAALAGFLLTAVPNWTAAGPVRGAPLIVLTAVWLAARVLAWIPQAALAYAAADLLFLPLLAASVAPAIIARNGRRNGIFVVFLGILVIANLAFHGESLELTAESASWGIRLAIGVLVTLIAIVGGRVVPAFTIGGMRMAGRPLGIEPAPRLDLAAILILAAMVLCDAVGLPAQAGGGIAAAAALVHAIRLARWQGWRTFAVPLVAVLHVGYGWLVVGLALKAIAAFSALVPATAALHALTAGCVGTMIVAIMSRASLGHTGRALHASRPVVVAYALITTGTVLRVFGPLLPVDAVPLIAASGFIWAAGFAVFAIAYLPILVGPRVDGRPG